MTVSTSLRSPFAGGMVTDRQAWEIGPQFSPFAQDGYSPNGDFRQRGGWKYDGTTADVAANLYAVARAKFILADVVQTYTAAGSKVYVHNAAAAGSSAGTNGSTGPVLPRCIYGDQLVWCYQDGTTSALLHSGVPLASPVSATTTSSNSGKATVTASSGSWAASVVPGAYFNLNAGSGDRGPYVSPRVLERNSSTSLTLDGIKFSSSASVTGSAAFGFGMVFPGVNVYDAGTGSFTGGNTFTGTGTKWATNGITGAGEALLALRTGADATCHYVVNGGVTDTTIGLSSTTKTDTDINYMILRSAPFKDAASHKGSFWGTGVAQYPSRVYVGPPGWNLAFPPGFELPYDPMTLPSSSNPNDFLMDFIDVPTAFEGDSNVAILSSPNPLLVLKRNAVYGIFGSYPQFSQSLLADGIGCIDIRSAQSLDEGQFWAGEGGIYWYTGGRIVDLTAGRINREWRALTRDFDYGVNDYCALGVEQGYVIVHITTGGGTTRRTYLYDLAAQSWQSRVSNFTPRYMFSSRIPGEASKLLSVSDDRQGHVLDFAPAIDGSGTAKDAAGTGPALQAWTPESIDGQDIDADMRMLDLAVHANVYDAGAAGATTLGVSVVTQDALTDPTTATTALDAIASDAVDRIDRHYYRRVDKRGRRHQVRVAVGQVGTDSAATKVEVSEITATFRSGRDRT